MYIILNYESFFCDMRSTFIAMVISEYSEWLRKTKDNYHIHKTYQNQLLIL